MRLAAGGLAVAGRRAKWGLRASSPHTRAVGCPITTRYASTPASRTWRREPSNHPAARASVARQRPSPIAADPYRAEATHDSRTGVRRQSNLQVVAVAA